jgi:23S rRNA (cytidine2498-2'-O)-methyltransferase
VIRAAYLAGEGLEPVLAENAARRGVAIVQWVDRLALSPDPPARLAWAQDTWLAPHLVPAMPAPRRPPRLAFPQAPAPPGESVVRLPDGTFLASGPRASPFHDGRARFHESPAPPGRAYLKLWEALTLLGTHPGPGDLCLDLGAAPGSWTWVCAALSARVIAVDRANLAPDVAAMLGVRHRAESAFGLDPRREPSVDWLLCDVIAYPPRTLALVRRWLDSGRAARIVATVKFQGPTDHGTADAFEQIAGGRLVHLAHNRHELTFLWPYEGDSA